VVRHQFAKFLTYLALEHTDSYTWNDFQKAFSALPIDGLEACAQAQVNNVKIIWKTALSHFDKTHGQKTKNFARQILLNG
jgi:hypothetical protein